MSGPNTGPPFASLLVANRGEVALRILRAAAELGIRTVAVHGRDDAASLHVQRADAVQPLAGTGAAAYLDVEAVLAAARSAGCDALHPGYGFLSENPALARACAEAGIVFVGPPAEILESFGDKVRCREIAARCGVPVLAATGAGTTLADAEAFRAALGPDASVMIKAARATSRFRSSATEVR